MVSSPILGTYVTIVLEPAQPSGNEMGTSEGWRRQRHMVLMLGVRPVVPLLCSIYAVAWGSLHGCTRWSWAAYCCAACASCILSDCSVNIISGLRISEAPQCTSSRLAGEAHCAHCSIACLQYARVTPPRNRFRNDYGSPGGQRGLTASPSSALCPRLRPLFHHPSTTQRAHYKAEPLRTYERVHQPLGD